MGLEDGERGIGLDCFATGCINFVTSHLMSNALFVTHGGMLDCFATGGLLNFVTSHLMSNASFVTFYGLAQDMNPS
jgi:hypothetical protein